MVEIFAWKSTTEEPIWSTAEISLGLRCQYGIFRVLSVTTPKRDKDYLRKTFIKCCFICILRGQSSGLSGDHVRWSRVVQGMITCRSIPVMIAWDDRVSQKRWSCFDPQWQSSLEMITCRTRGDDHVSHKMMFRSILAMIARDDHVPSIMVFGIVLVLRNKSSHSLSSVHSRQIRSSFLHEGLLVFSFGWAGKLLQTTS